MRTRPPQIDWRTYLDASLFPLKIFIVLAVVCLIGWHMQLSRVNPKSWGDITISPQVNPAWDFCIIAGWAALAYVMSAIALTIGGLVQAFFSTRRAAIWSLAFAITALIIGIWLKGYGKEAQDIYYSIVKH